MYASQAEKTKQLATLRTRAGRKLQMIRTVAGQVVHVLTTPTYYAPHPTS